MSKDKIRTRVDMRERFPEASVRELLASVPLAEDYNALVTYLGDGVLQVGTVAIDAAPEKFRLTTDLLYRLLKFPVRVAAVTAKVFSAAYTINTAGVATTAHHGAFLLQVTVAGVLSTKAVSADQDYATEAAAIAALPAADAGNLVYGWITVQGKALTPWTANTDDMTAASDCTAAHFYDASILTFPSPVS